MDFVGRNVSESNPDRDHCRHRLDRVPALATRLGDGQVRSRFTVVQSRKGTRLPNALSRRYLREGQSAAGSDLSQGVNVSCMERREIAGIFTSAAIFFLRPMAGELTPRAC
jgi:hypothetical protein